MTQNQDGASSAGERTSDELVRGFRLRPEYPRVTRLSRKVLAAASALGLAIIGGATVWALQKNRSVSPTSDEPYGTEHHNVAEGLGTLPRDYSAVQRQVPQLGPPLPGDLGRPILSAQGQLPVTAAAVPDQEQQRREQETEAARVSRLFASTNIREQPAAASVQADGRSTAPTTTAFSNDEAGPRNEQERKLTFVNGPVDRRTTSSDRLTRAASPYVVQAGTVIPGALITGIRSDLPGQMTTPLLLTEYVRGIEPKADFIVAGGTDFLRVDPEYDHGITGALRVARLGEAFGLDVEIHACGPAHRHLMSAMRNSNYYELALVGPECPNVIAPVFTCGYSDQLDCVGQDGCVPVPTGPGLGVSYDWDFIRKNAVANRVFA
ncbi:enolase C-terminal domain-like protein [Bradyrhizobium brasilense]|uniref:Enolase C-terminal domain-like protein n=1 Tax=Bradyrhizobium brasilense TaxID=1419277 RepID=A0ABY8JQU1_9BRAD|nr:enolase C-terminal domain-like protein [Bradyrhizobium brasilense]WFU68075.1 enolase C-terminal domain-like protein [Bradyrhizobium brasilense]